MKINDKILDLVKQVVFIANTPSYIYNSLRDEQVILEFANTKTAMEILKQLKDIEGKREKTIDDVVTVYLLVIALSLKNEIDTSQLFNLEFKDVEWFDYIVAIVNSRLVSIGSKIVRPNYPIEVDDYNYKEHSSNKHETLHLGREV